MRVLFTLLISLLFTLVTRAQTPTWSSDIAPILYANCTSCHHNGGIAPFSLMTYQDAQTWAFDINYAVTNRIMPPWPADPNYKHFAFERVLSAGDILKIQQWANGGAPAGDLTQAPAVPTYSNGSQLSTVNLSLKMQDYVVPTNGDKYINFVLPTGLTQAKNVTGIEVIPGNPQIVHHVLVFIDSTNNPINPNSAGGTGSSASQLIYGYVPGAEPYITPPGTGFRFPPNTRVIFQMHYAPGSQGQLDSTRINFTYTNSPIRQITVFPILNHLATMTNGPINIPANATRTYYEQAPVPANVTALFAWPHMHMVGRNIISFATKASPVDTIRLVSIPNWDFHWQLNYLFPNALKIPSGYTLRARAFYDNTTNNPDNPNSPPATVSAGEGSAEEMMMVFFGYMPYQNGDENLIMDKRIFPLGATTFCNGQSVTLRGINGVGYTYQWFRNGTAIPGAQANTYTATQAGSYTLSITLGPNNAISDPIVISVNAPPSASITPVGSTSICTGASVVLNANTGTGLSYQWFLDGSPIANATSSSYTATQVGAYTVSVYNGCYALSSAVSVTQSSTTPASITPSGPLSFCTGGNVSLQASAGSSYSWSNGATASSITVTQAGTYTVTVTQNGCTGTATQTVSINPQPTPYFTFNNNANSVNFTNGSSDATTYSWDFGDGNSSTAASPQHTYAAPGQYTVTLTATNSCGSQTYSTVVNLSCSPLSVSIQSAGTLQFCEGNSVELSTTAVTGYVYQWLQDGQLISGAQSATYSATASGVYTLQITDAQQCPGSSNNLTVNVWPLPTVPLITVNGNTLSTTGASNYAWSEDGQTVLGTTAEFTITQSGCYQVQIADANGCSNVSDTVCVQYTAPTEVWEGTEQPIVQFYPNPFTAQLEVAFTNLPEGCTVTVYDMLGREMNRQPVAAANGQLILDVPASLSSALYICTIEDAQRQMLHRARVRKQ